MHKLAIAVATGFLLLLVCGVALARPAHENSARELLEQPSNCTPPRSSADTTNPFCFVPSTISPAAQQFLSTSAAGAAFGAINFGTTPAEQAAAVATLRSVFPSSQANTSRAAEAQYIQSVRNASFAGVPVLVALPKGVQERPPADTKVVMYLHGECRTAACNGCSS
jgi:hypothetical protein